jgi:hypothetical protein
MKERTGVAGRALALTFALACLAVAPAAGQYWGSDACFDCHPSYYNDFKVSGHPYKLMASEEARNRPIPLPEGYSWDDISYVIGGYKWKSRYVGTDGYIITSIIDVDEYGNPTGDVIPGMNQYNNITGGWVNYHAGEQKPYDCGRCHTTGWVADEDWDTDGDLSDNQDGLPGIHGTFAFGGVQCEACHGPAAHFGPEFNPGDNSKEFCGSCHVRGDPFTIPASGGFIRHHEQYNEQLASPHYALDCGSCHNSHKKVEFSIVNKCEDCHGEVADAYAGTSMGAVGVDCIDCHMPYASKSAVAFSANKGDVRTHLFEINVDKNGEMFTADGGAVLLDDDGQGAVTLNFACGDCHRDKSSNWLAGKAKNFHQRGTKLAAGD